MAAPTADTSARSNAAPISMLAQADEARINVRAEPTLTASQAPTPDLARSQSAHADSDDDSAYVGTTPSDTVASISHHVKDADQRLFASLVGVVQQNEGLPPSDEDEARRIHDIDMLFGDVPGSSDVDAEPVSPASATHDLGEQAGTPHRATTAKGPPPFSAIGPLPGDSSLGSRPPSAASSVGSTNRSDLPGSLHTGQGAVIGPTPAVQKTVNTSSSVLPVTLASLLPHQTDPSPPTTSVPSVLPAKRPRGRPPKHPRPDGAVVAPKKATAPKRKAPTTDGGSSSAARKKATRPSSGKAASQTTSGPVSISDLGRMIPKNASPEAIQAFIEKNVKLFADLFMALQKQASNDRIDREKAKDELKGIGRSRSVGTSPVASGSANGEQSAPASRGQSAPPPLLAHGSSTGPGLFSVSSTPVAAPGAANIASSGHPGSSSAPTGSTVAPASAAAHSTLRRASHQDFSQVLTQALSEVMTNARPSGHANSATDGPPRPNAQTDSVNAAAASGATSQTASRRRKSEDSAILPNELKRRMTEIASGHESLREEMLRLKVDKQFFDTAQKTVDERIQVLRDRIAARSEDLYREREANRRAREEARQVKKDRKAAERLLKDAEKLEKRLEQQALELETEIAQEEQTRREREESQRLHAADAAATTATDTPAAETDWNGTTSGDAVPIPAALEGTETMAGRVSLDDAELAKMLGISLVDLSRFSQTTADQTVDPALGCASFADAVPAEQAVEPAAVDMDLSDLLGTAPHADGAAPSTGVAEAAEGAEAGLSGAFLAEAPFDLGTFLGMGLEAVGPDGTVVEDQASQLHVGGIDRAASTEQEQQARQDGLPSTSSSA